MFVYMHYQLTKKTFRYLLRHSYSSILPITKTELSPSGTLYRKSRSTVTNVTAPQKVCCHLSCRCFPCHKDRIPFPSFLRSAPGALQSKRSLQCHLHPLPDVPSPSHAPPCGHASGKIKYPKSLLFLHFP